MTGDAIGDRDSMTSYRRAAEVRDALRRPGKQPMMSADASIEKLERIATARMDADHVYLDTLMDD